jgi:hypothetical protein
MTLAEAEEIFAYWADNPPAHLMLQAIAAMLGWNKKARDEPADLAALAAAPGIRVISGPHGMPEPVLDAEAMRARNRQRRLALRLPDGEASR